MSLLTPPNSSHRGDKDKENRFSTVPLAGPSTRTVVWALEQTIHTLATPVKTPKICSKNRPATTKSILKKSAVNLLPTVQEDKQEREATPEPVDPLVDLHYLDRPVEQILAVGEDGEEEDLSELIEGYNVLAVRLRSSVSDDTDADASWPLFQPLRKYAQPLVDAVARDLGRALVDPLLHRCKRDAEEEVKFPLPSPQNSPMKKKGGLNEEQVKYARDLCTTAHSVIKALSVILSIPAISSVFHDNQLSQILTAILAIPLADELPTPNARKTCALAIWLIQVQRLPDSVLRPAADRIAYAIRRGIDGELGKEGKKGSANDGLKAIHDLCMHSPEIFVPAFTPVVPSLLSNLLAPTLALRVQACHALGGFAYASTQIPQSTTHTKIARHVASYLTMLNSPSAKSPTKTAEAMIVRTLRTTLQATDPVHTAQGPVWAISVIASLIVLLRSRICVDAKANRILSTLLGVILKHKKSSIRALGCIAWRPVTWAYFQPPLPDDPDLEDDEEESSIKAEQVKAIYLKVVTSVVDMQVGIGVIAAFLGDPNSSSDEPLRQAMDVIYNMTTKQGQSCGDAMEALRHMTNLYNPDDQDEIEPWDFKLLLPKGLFSSNPGLLTADFKSLTTFIRPLFNQVATIQDIRPLTAVEMTTPAVYHGIVRAWRTALERLELYDEAKVPSTVVSIWTNLLKANVTSLLEKGDDESICDLASDAARTLAFIAEQQFDFRPKKDLDNTANTSVEAILDSDDTIPDNSDPTACTEEELRVRVINCLWTVMKKTIPSPYIDRAAGYFIHKLMDAQMVLVPPNARMNHDFHADDNERARKAWVLLCLDILELCETFIFQEFWSCETEHDASAWVWSTDFTQAIWRTSVAQWIEAGGNWEAAVVLLGIPFSDRHAWDLSNDDFDTWEELLNYTTGKAMDVDGVEPCRVLTRVATFINQFQTPGLHPASSARLTDLICSHLDISSLEELPRDILELAISSLRATYPPEPRNKDVSMWMLRALSNMIEHSPNDLCLRLLQALEEPLCLWLSDENGLWTTRDYEYDILPLYQHILLRVQALPVSMKTLEVLRTLENILDSIFANHVEPSAAEAFKEWWKNTFALIPPPDQWSETITHCLQVTGILPNRVSTPNSPLVPAFIPLPSSPRTPVSSSFSTPPSAIIRREALSRPSSPHRPQKIIAGFPIIPTTPVSPLGRRSSLSTKRTPLSVVQLRSSPGKRRRISHEEEDGTENNKENVLADEIVSVVDRIISLKDNNKKRKLELDDDDSKPIQSPPKKKLKGKMKPKSKPGVKWTRLSSPDLSVTSSNESEDEYQVESTLIPSTSATSTTDISSDPEEGSSTPKAQTRRKKAAEFSDHRCDGLAEQVQLTRKEREYSKSFERVLTPTRKIDLTKLAKKRSVSNPEAILSFNENRKRKRSQSILEPTEDLYDACTSDPISSLPLPSLPPLSKRSYTVPFLGSDISVQSASSDDDPHLGQVTPHHLISPGIIRKAYSDKSPLTKSALTIMKELFGESPPSGDDSTSGSEYNSPVKDFIARQLQRAASSSKMTA